MAKTINYGNNKLDYKDFIANLSSNVDSYVNSHPEWSESQKALFKDEYTKLKNAMQESLDKDTDRFSIDEFGTITDKYGEFKNATDDDNLIDKHGNLVTDTEGLSKKKRAKLQAFKAPQLMANFAHSIADATVQKMGEQKKSIPGFADYWQQQHDPKRTLTDQKFWTSLDEEGKYTNRIQKTLEDLNNYTTNYSLPEEQLQDINKYKELLSSKDVGTDQWKKDLRMQAAKLGFGTWNDQFFGLTDAPSNAAQEDSSNPDDAQWLLQNVGSDEDRTNWKMYPGSRDAILSKLKSQYQAKEKQIQDAAAQVQQQQIDADNQKKWQDYLNANPWYSNVEKRLGRISPDNVYTSMYSLSNNWKINSDTVSKTINNLYNAVINGNKKGDYFRTPIDGGYTVNGVFRPIKTLGEGLAYALPYLEKQYKKALASNDTTAIQNFRQFFNQFEKVQDNYGHSIYKVKNSGNNQGHLYFYYKNGKLYSYRDTPYSVKYQQVVKAQLGTVLSTKYWKKQQEEQQDKAIKDTIKNPNTSHEQKILAKKQEKIGGNPLSDRATLLRTTALMTDVGAMIASFTGVGAPASALTGAVATAQNQAADMAEGQGFLESLGNNAWSYGMDALSVLPFLRGAVGTSRILKTATKLAPHIITAIGATAMIKNKDQYINSWNKMIDSPSKLNRQDWSNIYDSLRMVIAGTTTGTQAMKGKRTMNAAISQDKARVKTNQGYVTIDKAKLDAIKKTSGLEAQNKLLQEATGNQNIRFNAARNRYRRWKEKDEANIKETELYDFSKPNTRVINGETYERPYKWGELGIANHQLTSPKWLKNLRSKFETAGLTKVEQSAPKASPQSSTVSNIPTSNLSAVINPKPQTLSQSNPAFEGSIANIRAQQAAANARRRQAIENIDDSHAPAAAANRNQYLEREGVDKAVQESKINQASGSTYQKLLQEYKQAQEAVRNSSNIIDANYYREYMDVVRQQLRDLTPAYNKLRASLQSSPSGQQITFTNGQTSVVRNWQDIVKKYNLKYKEGGVIKAQKGTKTDWRLGLTPYDVNNYKATLDTSNLYSGDLSNGLKPAWVSNKEGNATGRYTPTTGLTREQIQIVQNSPYYKDFGKLLFNDSGTSFSDMGKSWAQSVDKLLPSNSMATFYDANGNLRTSWTANNNDPYGRAAKKFTNLKDYVNYMRNDDLLGARHNIFVNQGKRYYYLDNNKQRVYIDPNVISKYKLADTTTQEWNPNTFTNWTDQEIIGLAPESSKVTDEGNFETSQQKKSLFNFKNLSPTITYGIPRAIAADRINRKITDLTKTNPLLIDPLTIHRNIYSDYNTEATGYNNWAKLRNLASQPISSDASLNTAARLDANLKGQQMYQQAIAQSDQLARQSAEAAWEQEKQNKQSLWQTANTNREAIHDNDVENRNREAAYYTQKYQIWDTVAQELQQNALTNYKLNQARADQLAQKDIENYTRTQILNPAVYSKYGLSPNDIAVWNDINKGLKQSSDLTNEERQAYIRVSNAADDLSTQSLRSYYGIPQSQFYTPYKAPISYNIKLKGKKGGKLDIEFLKAAAKDADRFYKTTKDFADRTERAIARLQNIKKKRKNK